MYICRSVREMEDWYAGEGYQNAEGAWVIPMKFRRFIRKYGCGGDFVMLRLGSDPSRPWQAHEYIDTVLQQRSDAIEIVLCFIQTRLF